MNYYLIRDCPYPAPKDNDTICYYRRIAESWDIKYIMQTNKDLPSQVLYQHKDGSVVYVDASDYHTFDMLDAFDIPHLNSDDITVIIPQVGTNKKGTRFLTIHKNTQDVKGDRKSTVYPSMHQNYVVNTAMTLPIRALNYTIRIGKWLLRADNTLTKHNER